MAFLNAHASSTQLNDADEALCIQEIFNGQAKKVPVSGTKPYYGHPLGASAAIEGVVCALAIRDGLISGNFELSNSRSGVRSGRGPQ